MNIGYEDIVIKEDKDVSTLEIFSTIDPILLGEGQKKYEKSFVLFLEIQT